MMLIFMMISAAASAENVSRVKFSGQRPGDLTGLYNRPGVVFVADSVGTDSSKIAEYYHKQGWYNCAVEITSRSRVDGIEITYKIIKNQLYKLRFTNDSFDVADSSYMRVHSLVEEYYDKPATSGNLNALADDIIAYYANIGYPYCEVRYDDIRLEFPDILTVTLDIQPGPAVTIEKIAFTGRKNLNEQFLQSYIGIMPPMQYSTDAINAAYRRLTRAEFIDEVEQPELRYLQIPERGVIVYPINEASPLILDGAAGYSSKDDNFYGKFNATLTNILGKGRQAKLEWAKKDKQSHHLRLEYTEPYPLNFPVNLVLDFYQEDRDSLYIDNGGSVGIHYLGSEIYTYGVAVGASELNPEPYGRSILPHKTKLKLSISLAADTRDHKLNPHTGDYLYLKANFISETVKEDSLFRASNINYRTAELRYEKCLPLGRTSVMYGSIYAAGDFSNNLTADRLIPLGGFGSLRGYMQDQFYVSRLAIGTLEYRLLTSRQGRMYIFTDGAVFQLPETGGNDSSTEYKTAFGVGLTAPVKLGQAIVEIAVPEDDGFSNAKLHFGIKAGF
jgi:outer membrane protein insertion porin family